MKSLPLDQNKFLPISCQRTLTGMEKVEKHQNNIMVNLHPPEARRLPSIIVFPPKF